MDYKKYVIVGIVFFLILTIFVIKLKSKNNSGFQNNDYENSSFMDTVADPINYTYTAYDENNTLKQYTLTEEEIEFYNNHPDYNPEPTY